MKNLIRHPFALLILILISLPVFSVTNQVNTDSNQFRSGKEQLENFLQIIATKDGITTGTVITEYAMATNKYDPEDIYKQFTWIQDVADVYTLAEGNISTDGYACAFNKFNIYPFIAPLGVRTTFPGKVTLDFKGADSFKEADVYLINIQDGTEQNLKEILSYEVNLDGKGEVILFVSFRKASISTDNRLTKTDKSIQIYAAGGEKINVKSSPNDLIKKVIIYNLSGNIIHQFYGSPNTYYHEVSVPKNQVYLVQVFTENNTRIAKVLMK